jgi:hypothetical protein
VESEEEGQVGEGPIYEGYREGEERYDMRITL